MQDPTKAPTRFKAPSTPRRRVLGDIANYNQTPSPRKVQLEKDDVENRLHDVPQEGARKDIHLDWMGAQYSRVVHANNDLKSDCSCSSSPRKLHKALDDNAKQEAYIDHLEQETTKHLDRILDLQTKWETCLHDAYKLRQEMKDCSHHLETGDQGAKALVEELERVRANLEATEARVLSLLEFKAVNEQELASNVRVNKGLHADLKHASAITKDMNKLIEEQDEQITRLRAEVKETDQTEEDSKQFEQENASLKQHLGFLQEQLAASKKEITILTEKQTTAIEQSSALKDRLIAVGKERDNFKKQMETSKAALTTAIETVPKLSKEIENRELTISELNKEIEDYKERITANSDIAANQLNLNNDLESKLGEIEFKYSKLGAELNECEEERRKLEAELSATNLKQAEAQDLNPEVIKPRLMTRESPARMYNEVSQDESPAPMSPLLASPPAVELVQPWEWLSRASSFIKIEKKDDAEYSFGVEMAARENEDFVGMMGRDWGGSEAEAEVNMGGEKGEDINDPADHFPSNEKDEEQGTEPGVYTDKEEEEERMYVPANHDQEQGDDTFRDFLHHYF